MGYYGQGLALQETDLLPATPTAVSVVAMNWYVNRTPFVTRTRRVPVGTIPFNIVNRIPRPRSTTLAAAMTDTTTTTITLTDASIFMLHDILLLASGERVQITADPNITANTIVATRGAEGTTAATQSNATTVTLIGNARTGAEVNQTALSQKPTAINQYCQTWMHPVQIGGSLQAQSGTILQPGADTPFAQYKMDALQNLMDDMEYTSYYSLGYGPASTTTPSQVGLRQQAVNNGNIVTSPTNAGAYKATDFIRDLVETPRANGGNPDAIFVSSNYMIAFATWGMPLLKLDAGATNLGVSINSFSAPFLNDIDIIEAPLLKPYTAFSVTSQRVYLAMLRGEFWNPHGVRGDAVEGDWIAEGACALENPLMHCWTEGVTAFSYS